MVSTRPTLSPHIIGQYFNLDRCQMYLTLEYDEEAQEQIGVENWKSDDKNPLLKGQGVDFERRQLKAIPEKNHKFVVPGDTEWSGFDERVSESEYIPERTVVEKVQAIARADVSADRIVLYQPRLSGTIGAYDIEGLADIIGLIPAEGDDTLNVVVFEVKNSDEQKVSHRFQAGIYAHLLSQTIEEAGFEVTSIKTFVLTQANNIIENGITGIGNFEYEPYLGKLQLLLSEGKVFDEILLDTPYEDTYNRIDSRCSGCTFESVCVSRAANNKGLELLGLDESTQQTLEDIEIDGGITDLEDFANLFEQPGNDSHHLNFESLTPRNQELVDTVRERTDITDLQEQTQIAYHFLTELDWDYSGWEDNYSHHLQGSGYNLPWNDHNVDDPDFSSNTDPDYPQGSLIQVYLYVQHDHALGRLSQLSAIVESDEEGQQPPISESIEEITPDDRLNQRLEEKKLLRRFFDSLGQAIADAKPDLTDDGFDENQGFPHVYIYSDHQRTQLVEALRRHEEINGSPTIRKLLGLRPGIDQKMVSILQQEFRERQAFRFPGLGIVQATAHYYDSDGGEWFDWKTERSDNSELEFPRVFSRGFFDGYFGHDNPNGGLELDHSSNRELDAEEYNYTEWVYPVENRETDQIPAEYLWGVHDMLSPDEADNPDLIKEFLYRDSSYTTEITEEDIDLFAIHMCKAIRHIVTSTWNKDRSVTKAPLNVAEFSEIEFDERTLAEAIREYQQLEFWTDRDSQEAYYRKPLSERVAAGEALLVKNTHGEIIRPDDPSEYPDAYIEGPLLHAPGEEYDPDEHENVATRTLSVSADDWCVTVRTTEDSPPEQLHGQYHNPKNLQHGATTIIQDLDSEDGWVRALVMGGWPRGNPIDERYCVWHYDWTDESPADDNEVFIDENPSSDDPEIYVIDPSVDKITQSRAAAAMEPERITENVIYNRLNQVYVGEREDLSINGYQDRLINRYINAVAYFDDTEENPGPNSDQSDLILDTTHSVVLLQGPPGTGKTRYTLAPAVLSRVHAASSTNTDFVGCISAVSHDAVNEAMESVAELGEECPPTKNELDLIRVCSSEGQDIQHPDINNIIYHNLSDDELVEYYNRFIDRGPEEQETAILAGTPASIYRFVDKMAEAADDSDAGTLMEEREARMFDLAIVDEASMMDLPAMFLVTAFVNEEGQTILVGDHRQMEPIQQHDWEREDRVTIERNRPFMSALNFLRFLRSDIDESEFLRAQPPELEDPEETIPMHQLTITYRLPENVAQMHTDLYYEEDGIHLTSRAEHDPFPDMREDTNNFLSEVLDPAQPISLLEHFDDEGEKENPIEAAIIQELLDPFTVVEEDPDAKEEITAGVVVPYNRQKRLLNYELNNSIKVDTVEKFQGRERNLIIVSAASADPSYVNKLAEFLLNPNRFNVAKSRMMQKVIIIAGDSVFQASSSETDDFDDQTPWVEFYGHMGGFAMASADAVDEVSNIVDETALDELIAESHLNPDRDVKVRKMVGYNPEFEFSDIRK